jgi:hypothetical protein
VVTALEPTAESRDLLECLAEAREEIERLEIEIAWCASLLDQWPRPAPH